MGTVTVRGKQFEVDAMDADFMARFEDARAQLAEEGRQQQEDYTAHPETRLSERIRRECRSIFTFFDTALGDGAAETIFGGRTNLNTCLDAAEELIGAVAGMQEAYNKRLGAYSPARLKRAAK